MFKYLSIIVVLGLGMFAFQNCAISADSELKIGAETVPPIIVGTQSPLGLVQTEFDDDGAFPIYKLAVQNINSSLIMYVPQTVLKVNETSAAEVLWYLDDAQGNDSRLSGSGATIDLHSTRHDIDLFFEGKITAKDSNNTVLAIYFLTDADRPETPPFITSIQNTTGPPR